MYCVNRSSLNEIRVKIGVALLVLQLPKCPLLIMESDKFIFLSLLLPHRYSNTCIFFMFGH